jgi:hypothetical protein
MPVNPLPVLIPLFLLWCGCAFFLFRWRRGIGVGFVVLSIVVLAIHILNTGVEAKTDEQMAFRVVDFGANHLVELKTSHGDTVTCDWSPDLVARLRVSTNRTVRVVMTGWYDYGHLSSYHITSIDGVLMP